MNQRSRHEELVQKRDEIVARIQVTILAVSRIHIHSVPDDLFYVVVCVEGAAQKWRYDQDRKSKTRISAINNAIFAWSSNSHSITGNVFPAPLFAALCEAVVIILNPGNLWHVYDRPPSYATCAHMTY